MAPKQSSQILSLIVLPQGHLYSPGYPQLVIFLLKPRESWDYSANCQVLCTLSVEDRAEPHCLEPSMEQNVEQAQTLHQWLSTFLPLGPFNAVHVLLLLLCNVNL